MRVLAEKVQTHAEHAQCLSLGCGLFHGYFYRKPQTITERRVDLSQGSKFKLIVALQKPDLDGRAV
ncbi:MAG: hypothetical protein ACP5H2_05365 [Solirubrobacteraceae bacterium]